MTEWNAHQKLGNAIKRMAHFESRVRKTRQRRTPAEKRANSIAWRALARAIADAQKAFCVLR